MYTEATREHTVGFYVPFWKTMGYIFTHIYIIYIYV